MPWKDIEWCFYFFVKSDFLLHHLLKKGISFNNHFLAQVGPSSNLFPVMVYIHDGDFEFGSGSAFPGHMLSASQQVVVVTFNYRLGLLGELQTNAFYYWISSTTCLPLDTCKMPFYFCTFSWGNLSHNFSPLGYLIGPIRINLLKCKIVLDQYN